jgi:hypothetical protein
MSQPNLSQQKRKSKYTIEIARLARQTPFAGQVLVDGVCRLFGVWEALAKTGALQRSDVTGCELSPDMLAAQVIFTLASGGRTLADTAAFQSDAVLLKALGMPGAAAPGVIAAWLNRLSPECVAELCVVNAALVRKVMLAAKASRIFREKDHLNITYTDIAAVVEGTHVEPSQWDVRWGGRLPIYAFWCGPFLLECGTGAPASSVPFTPHLVRKYRSFWQNLSSTLFAHGSVFSGMHLTELANGGIRNWSIGCDYWDQTFPRNAIIPQTSWRNKQAVKIEEYASFRHPLEGTVNPPLFAAARRLAPHGGYRYAFLAYKCEVDRTPEDIFAAHRAFWRSAFAPPPLASLGVYYPQCSTRTGNNAFYALTSIAYNVVTALKVLELPDEAQAWHVDTVIRNVLLLPAEALTHASQSIFRIDAAPHPRQMWWETTASKYIPKRERKNQSTEERRAAES